MYNFIAPEKKILKQNKKKIRQKSRTLIRLDVKSEFDFTQYVSPFVNYM